MQHFTFHNEEKFLMKLLELFVSRVRPMECLLPDGPVCICSVPLGPDHPLRTPLRGLVLVKDLKQDQSTSLREVLEVKAVEL